MCENALNGDPSQKIAKPLISLRKTASGWGSPSAPIVTPEKDEKMKENQSFKPIEAGVIVRRFFTYSSRTSNGITLRAINPPFLVGASFVASRGM